MSVDVASTIGSLRGFQFCTYLHVAGAALLVFDWFLTLEAEVNHVWNAPWNLGRILFFGTRYLVFIDSLISLYYEVGYSISGSTCHVLSRVTGYMQLFGIIWAEVILTLRVWALWGRGRNMGIFLGAVSIVNGTVGILGSILFGPTYHYISMDSLSPTLPGCFFNLGNPSLFWISFTALTVHLTFIFIMTMLKAFQYYGAETRGTSLIQTFFTDGVIYYLTLQVLSVVNLVVIILLPRIGFSYINLLTSLQRVFHAVLSARIILHLRYEAKVLRGMEQNSETLMVI